MLASRAFSSGDAQALCICPLRHAVTYTRELQGHLVHIDFGFMLSNSPGGVHFERAPFKLTAEYLAIMDSNVVGAPSPVWDYFRVCFWATLRAFW